MSRCRARVATKQGFDSAACGGLGLDQMALPSGADGEFAHAQLGRVPVTKENLK